MTPVYISKQHADRIKISPHQFTYAQALTAALAELSAIFEGLKAYRRSKGYAPSLALHVLIADPPTD